MRLLADDARALVGYDGHGSPPDWRPFMSELADEVAGILELLAPVPETTS